MANLEFNSTVSVSNIFGNNDSGDAPGNKRIVSDEAAAIFDYAIDIGFSMVLAICGIVGNALSLTTYAKLGFKDTMNISMTFICSWDLLRCILGFFSKFYVPLDFISPTLGAEWYTYGFLSLGYPANIALYVSGVLAGYVAVERCLCVSLPFTVKILLTRKVVLLSNLLISVVVPASLVTSYLCFKMFRVFRQDLNATVLSWRLSDRCVRHSLFSVYQGLIGPFWLLLSFVVISSCTVIISYHLRQASKFKSQNKNGGGVDKENTKSKTLSSRDGQVIRMLSVIIFFYILTGLPRILVFISYRIFIEDFRYGGRFSNFFEVVRSASTTIEFINYNVNIFIFYFMSSQFKAMFRSTFFCFGKGEKTSKQPTCYSK